MDFTNLKRFMDGLVHTSRTPGCAVAVSISGQPVFCYASGYADLENRRELTGEELFNIYSCSKIATVTAGMQLLERGEFWLNDPLYDYLPEFKEMMVKRPDGGLEKAKNPITIGDLFAMTAGFTYDLESPGFRRARELTGGKMDTVQAIRCVADDPLSFEPGAHWQYSICHDVLAAVVSVISGKKFREYVKENIFDPLGMTESVYHHTPETLARTAEQYQFVASEQAGGEAFDAVEAQKQGCGSDGEFRNVGKAVSQFVLGEEYDSGGAGITTSVTDYVKLMAALGNNGIGATGERILSRYAINLMRTNRLNETQLKDFNWKGLAGCGYGLGVRTHINPARSGIISTVGEFGWGGAAGASAIIDPDIGLGVFFAQHCLNPREEHYQPKLRSVVYSCLD